MEAYILANNFLLTSFTHHWVCQAINVPMVLQLLFIRERTSAAPIDAADQLVVRIYAGLRMANGREIWLEGPCRHEFVLNLELCIEVLLEFCIHLSHSLLE